MPRKTENSPGIKMADRDTDRDGYAESIKSQRKRKGDNVKSVYVGTRLSGLFVDRPSIKRLRPILATAIVANSTGIFAKMNQN